MILKILTSDRHERYVAALTLQGAYDAVINELVLQHHDADERPRVLSVTIVARDVLMPDYHEAQGEITALETTLDKERAKRERAEQERRTIQTEYQKLGVRHLRREDRLAAWVRSAYGALSKARMLDVLEANRFDDIDLTPRYGLPVKPEDG